MSGLQYRSFDSSTDVRPFPNGRAEVVVIDEATVGRVVYQPGWRWSRDMALLTGTPTCQLRHVGYAISGTMHIRMDDGQEIDLPAGVVYEIPAGHDGWVVGDEPWVTVAWTSIRSYGLAAETPGDRVMATVLFTDIVGSTGTLETVGDARWRELLMEHNARLREDLNRYRGREIATTGDGFLAVFDSASRGVNAAMAMSASAANLGLAIRAGLHSGEVEMVGSSVRGLAVHAAQRVMALAGPGEVLVSSTTADLLEGSGLAVHDAGVHQLRGLTGQRHLFRVAGADRPQVAAR